MNDEIREWHCEKGHVLGLVVKDSGGSHLLLYRNAVDDGAESPAQVDVIARIDSANDIRCGICGVMRTWVPSQEAFDRLMKHYKSREGKVEKGEVEK